jgi:hypothetical protein
MGPPEVRDKLVYPTAVGVIAALVAAGIVTAAKSALFWAIVGAVTFVVTLGLVVRSFARLGRDARELRAALADLSTEVRTIATGVDREGSALRDLAGDGNRLARRLGLLERYALPDWLRVAVAFNLARGGHVDPEANGIRFSEPNGVEILMVTLPVNDEDWVMSSLHDRLGLDNNTYLEALLGIDREYAADQGHADRLRVLEDALDDIRRLVERNGETSPK